MTGRGTSEGELERFWADARVRGRLTGLPAYFGPTVLASVVPPTFAFSDEHAEADRLLEQVLDGTRTASATPLFAYEQAGASLPAVGDLSIALDGDDRPRALLATTGVRTVRAADVDLDHARAEAHDSVAAWRADLPGVGDDTPVVLETFAVLHPATQSGATFRAMFGR
ncbi:ASCH domain-containing protein [Nocardioides marmoraquaticus]